jgi:hypothetical protein
VNQRSDASWLRVEYAASERRVCGLLGIAVSSYRYRTVRCDDELRARLVELAREKPRFGYRRLHVLLLRAGHITEVQRGVGLRTIGPKPNWVRQFSRFSRSGPPRLVQPPSD